MRNAGRSVKIIAVLVGIVFAPTLLFSQDLGGPPKPAARVYSPLGGLSDADTQNSSQEILPDSRPLTGVQSGTLGSPELRHSYWVPGFEYGNFIRSSSAQNPAVSGWNSTSYVGGDLDLLQAWRHALLNLSYSGGGFMSTDDSVGNGHYHQVGLVQQFNWQRWQLSFIDQFAFLPETQFGFAAGSNLSIPGIGGTLGAPPTGLQSTYLPSQSIYSALGPRYSDAFVTEIGYRVSPRTSLTLAGSYGFLSFTEPGNIDTKDAIFSVGYDYAISRYDALGVLYRFSAYHFAGEPQAIGDHTVQLAYGRKITGRIALQLFGGPDIAQFRIPIGASTQRISGAGAANLIYTPAERTNLWAGYAHSVNGGSGVFTGAVSDQIQGGLNHQLTRLWHGGVHFGYSRNSTILQSSSVNSPHYSTWFTGGNLERSLGQHATFSLAYTAYLESSNQNISSVGSPYTSYTQHQITAEFRWHTRPFVIR